MSKLSSPPSTLRRLLVLAIALALIAAACGSDSPTENADSASATDTTVAETETEQVPKATPTPTVADPVDVEPETDVDSDDNTATDSQTHDDDVSDEDQEPAEATACEANLAAFATQPQVDARCDGDWLLFDGTGLAQIDADHPAMMVGITAWILRVPLPFQYDWRIPSVPEWLDGTIQASPRGPIAVAVDGVPIFHYEARPDGSTALADYDARSDTVVAGELDHCGGHAGQGEDYHYHYAPVCLIDDHDPGEPIAFGLDGAPIFIGTAGDDYYGLGQYNDIDLTPDEPLDDCNAVQLDDGSWVHYTTSEPPYLIGCHHGAVDSSLQIEPAPMREQRTASPYGGQVGEPIETLVTNWYVDGDGWMHLEHESFDGNGTSAIVYRQADGDDCWDFDFREDARTADVFETYCRPTR